jgi:hypothetical protein
MKLGGKVCNMVVVESLSSQRREATELCRLLKEEATSFCRNVCFKQAVCPRVVYGTELSNYIIGLDLKIRFYPKEFTTRVKSTAVTSTWHDLPAAEACVFALRLQCAASCQFCLI